MQFTITGHNCSNHTQLARMQTLDISRYLTINIVKNVPHLVGHRTVNYIIKYTQFRKLMVTKFCIKQNSSLTTCDDTIAIQL